MEVAYFTDAAVCVSKLKHQQACSALGDRGGRSDRGGLERNKKQEKKKAMKSNSKNIIKAALAFVSLPILPAVADYCTFDNGNCIDGLAQVSVSFQFDAISPVPLNFYYGYDAGWGSPSNENACAVKVGYWLQYDRGTVTEFNSNIRGINWTTEVALRIGNLGGYVGGANNGCDGVWGGNCSENLKTFLRSSLFNLSTSGQPYDLPLDTVLQPLTTGSPGPIIDGCPSTLFDLDLIPTYGETSHPCFFD